MSHTVPNWAQAQMAKAVGLEPDSVAVRHEDDRKIVFLHYKDHVEIIVCKISGQILNT